MQRRAFLGTVVVSATGVLGACGSSDDAGSDSTDAPPSGHFPQSVASGDPTPSSVILWTRVVDDERDDDLDVVVEFVAGAVSAATPQAFQDLASNGFAVVEASDSRLEVTLHRLDFDKVHERSLGGNLGDHFEEIVFELEADSPGTLYRMRNDLRERWNAEDSEWEEV